TLPSTSLMQWAARSSGRVMLNDPRCDLARGVRELATTTASLMVWLLVFAARAPRRSAAGEVGRHDPFVATCRDYTRCPDASIGPPSRLLVGQVPDAIPARWRRGGGEGDAPVAQDAGGPIVGAEAQAFLELALGGWPVLAPVGLEAGRV